MRRHVERQNHGDGRPLAQARIAVYRTAVQSDNGIDIGKAVAVSRARGTSFGSVKPLEHVLLTLFRHADTSIGDSQLNTTWELSCKRNGDRPLVRVLDGIVYKIAHETQKLLPVRTNDSRTCQRDH